jgi:hypothetical protein
VLFSCGSESHATGGAGHSCQEESYPIGPVSHDNRRSGLRSNTLLDGPDVCNRYASVTITQEKLCKVQGKVRKSKPPASHVLSSLYTWFRL